MRCILSRSGSGAVTRYRSGPAPYPVACRGAASSMAVALAGCAVLGVAARVLAAPYSLGVVASSGVARTRCQPIGEGTVMAARPLFGGGRCGGEVVPTVTRLVGGAAVPVRLRLSACSSGSTTRPAGIIGGRTTPTRTAGAPASSSRRRPIAMASRRPGGGTGGAEHGCWAGLVQGRSCDRRAAPPGRAGSGRLYPTSDPDRKG